MTVKDAVAYSRCQKKLLLSSKDRSSKEKGNEMKLRSAFVVGAFLFAAILLHGMFFSSQPLQGQAQNNQQNNVGRYQVTGVSMGQQGHVYLLDTQTGQCFWSYGKLGAGHGLHGLLIG